MENMENELDVVIMVDDEGNEITMEVLQYFFYEGAEYAVLSELPESCEDCESDCDSCATQREAYIMKVEPVGEDEEEFIPVDEDLAAKLIDLIESGAFDDDEFEDEDEE